MDLVVDRGTDRLAVKLFEVQNAATLAVLVPAMGVPASYYERFAVSLNEAGIAVALADLRGTGLSTPQPSRTSRYGYGDLAGDVGAVLESLAAQRVNCKTILIGHSLGGQACVMHLAKNPDAVDGLVLIAVGLPYWRTYGRQKLGVYGMTQGIGSVSALLGVWPGWGFGGRQASRVMRDWAYTGRRGHFPPRLGIDLAQLTAPVLAITVDNDQFIPRSTMDYLTSQLTSAKVTSAHLSTAEAGIPLDHFKWVKAGDAITPHLTQWLSG
jgi:predicted alpha/beta hydrolase